MSRRGQKHQKKREQRKDVAPVVPAQKAFRDETEILDGKAYHGCTFTRCHIVYKGGPLPQMDGCSFEDCSWDLDEAATRTLDYLRSIYHGMGPSGRDIVEATFDGIRQPPHRGPMN